MVSVVARKRVKTNKPEFLPKLTENDMALHNPDYGKETRIVGPTRTSSRKRKERFPRRIIGNATLALRRKMKYRILSDGSESGSDEEVKKTQGGLIKMLLRDGVLYFTIACVHWMFR